MSTGTRKKKLDYISMLHNDVDNEFINRESWRNPKSDKKTKESASTFLRKKRQLAITSKNQLSKEKEQRLQRIKNQEKENKITKDEYDAILADYSDEIKTLGINPVEVKEETSSLISDLNSLYYNLFYYTKFENSKPYKMIDYIINNDNFLINRPNDKERFEEIKKSVFSKNKLNKDDNLTVIFKSLYEYFKTDFSKSFIFKLFEKINDNLQNYGNGAKNDETVSLSQEKKDKFTYSNFLTERLRQTNNYSLISYTNDKDFVKSLIYLNNKSNRHLNKKNKLDKKLIEALRQNSETINKLSSQPLNYEEMKYAKNILKNNKLNKFIRKKFSWVINCIDKMKESNMDEKQFVKFVDTIFKNKEDECEKASKGFKGDTKTLWICIKFIFYLHMLSKKDNVVYFSDNNFWKTIMTYLDSKKHMFSSPKFRFKTPEKGKTRNKENIKKTLSKLDSDYFQVSSEKKEGKEGVMKENELVNLNTDFKEKDIEMDGPITLRNPMEDIKQIVVKRYDEGEDIFTFIREDKKSKKKDKENDKGREEKDSDIQIDKSFENDINMEIENDKKKPNEVEKRKETKKLKDSEKDIIDKSENDTLVKEVRIKVKRPRGRGKRKKEVEKLVSPNKELKLTLNNLQTKKINKENEDNKSAQSKKTITSQTITDNGLNDINPNVEIKSEEKKPLNPKGKGSKEKLSTKIVIQNPHNYHKEGIFGVINEHNQINEKNGTKNLIPIQQDEPKPKKPKGRPRKNKISIPLTENIKQNDVEIMPETIDQNQSKS